MDLCKRLHYHSIPFIACQVTVFILGVSDPFFARKIALLGKLLNVISLDYVWWLEQNGGNSGVVNDQDERSSQSSLFGQYECTWLFHGEGTSESDRVNISRQGGSHQFRDGLVQNVLTASDSLDAGRDENAL